jgi:hypothetical protein
MAIAGADGIRETSDAGKTWKLIAPLPPKFDIPKPGGWFTTVAWDPAHHLFYTSHMGLPTYKLDASKGR